MKLGSISSMKSAQRYWTDMMSNSQRVKMDRKSKITQRLSRSPSQGKYMSGKAPSIGVVLVIGGLTPGPHVRSLNNSRNAHLSVVRWVFVRGFFPLP